MANKISVQQIIFKFIQRGISCEYPYMIKQYPNISDDDKNAYRKGFNTPLDSEFALVYDESVYKKNRGLVVTDYGITYTTYIEEGFFVKSKIINFTWDMIHHVEYKDSVLYFVKYSDQEDRVAIKMEYFYMPKNKVKVKKTGEALASIFTEISQLAGSQKDIINEMDVLSNQSFEVSPDTETQYPQHQSSIKPKNIILIEQIMLKFIQRGICCEYSGWYSIVQYPNISDDDKAEFRKGFNIPLDTEFALVHSTSPFCDQGLVITDSGITCIPDNDAPNNIINFTWDMIHHVEYKDLILYFFIYPDQNKCVDINIKFFYKSKDQAKVKKTGEALASIFTEMAQLAEKSKITNVIDASSDPSPEAPHNTKRKEPLHPSKPVWKRK
jgi:hypothetical protein